MAGKLRYFKEQNGNFYTRIAVPEALKQFIGTSQLQQALGSDRRVAERDHHAAVARFQTQIADAQRNAAQAGLVEATPCQFPLTAEQIALSHYRRCLALDERLRSVDGYASVGIDDGRVEALRLAIAGRLREAALLETIGAQVERYRTAGNHDAIRGSTEWNVIARALCVAEYEALERVFEKDEGDFSGEPTNPILSNTKMPVPALPSVPLTQLFEDYIASRKAIGKHRDDGASWRYVILDLVKFLGHGDARKITKRNLLDWRDALMVSGKAAKTISDKYLAAIRAVLRWAFEDDRLPSNEAQTVQQQVPKKVRSRERGYTTSEAVKILRTSFSYQPAEAANRANRESSHITAAKRWVPLLCAFTGARVTEMSQLRKEDVRQEGNRWILRVTPQAGSVKTGQYRDVPLHLQVIALGFIDFLQTAKVGPLFHGAKDPSMYLANARITSGRISEWLHELKLVPADVAPSYGWRHRFKTQGLELGTSDRVLDGIQGHPGKNASAGYGDVSIAAMLNIIDALPDYELKFGPQDA